jgi:TPR repeat protein
MHSDCFQCYFVPISFITSAFLFNLYSCSADAKFNIGAMMLGGFGVAKDYGQALAMFSHAANMVCEVLAAVGVSHRRMPLQGHLHALFNVAMMHLNGFGTQRNCQLASTYLKVGCWRRGCMCVVLRRS